MRLWVQVAFCLASLVACAPGLPQPTAAHLAVAQRTEPTATLEDLARGRASYAAKCGNCHALREPHSLAAGDWQRVVDEMREKQSVHLTPQENRDIVRYLDAVAGSAR
jgi:cytochrome c5